MEADRRMRPQTSHSNAEAPMPVDHAEIKDLPKLLRELSKTAPASDQKELAESIAAYESLLEYVDRKAEIEAASEALEDHRAAFLDLVRDQERFLALTQTLFAEPCFVPLRFTAADVRSAVAHVGDLSLGSIDKENIETLRAAILHLATKERRHRLALGLLCRLPEFVRAGRFQEGWLLQSAAMETTENLDRISVFLFRMFAFGYEEINTEQLGKDKELLRSMGFDLDRLATMSPDELEDWLRAQAEDPARRRMIEEHFRDHRELREEGEANLRKAERDSVKLLESEDSRFLLAQDEEIFPWIERLNALFNESNSSRSTPGARLSKEDAQRIFKDRALPLMREMAVAIFDQDRICKLVGALKEFRKERFTAGDRDTAQQATGAIACLHGEVSPEDNIFLLTLCWQSIHIAVQTQAAHSRGPASEPCIGLT